MLQDNLTLNRPCPCGSNKPYRECCEPAISGKTPAPTAEALMRSRYTAFALGQVDYLIETLASGKRRPDDAAVLTEQTGNTIWTGLQILGRRKGRARDERGEVEFIASFESGDEKGRLHERSRFRRERGRWVYVDGDVQILPAL